MIAFAPKRQTIGPGNSKYHRAPTRKECATAVRLGPSTQRLALPVLGFQQPKSQTGRSQQTSILTRPGTVHSQGPILSFKFLCLLSVAVRKLEVNVARGRAVGICGKGALFSFKLPKIVGRRFLPSGHERLLMPIRREKDGAY
jgi:hypothetical protein